MQEQELVERVRALVPMVAEYAAQAEQERKPVDSVMKALEEAGVYKFFVPTRYGGYQFSLETFMEIGMLLGEGCLSTAWVTTFCMEHNWLIGLYNQEAQDHIFGKHPYIIAPGALAPRGVATPVKGGFRLTGQWQWGTGVMHANWVMVGALTEGADPPELCMYALPIEQAEIIDTWQMSGMAGTGSNDIAIKDAFVPGYLRQQLTDMRAGDSPGADIHKTATYRMPMLPVLGLTAAAPAVGCAKKTVDLFKQSLLQRMVYGTQNKLSDRALAQSKLAHLTVRLNNTEQALLQIASEVMQWGESGNICPDIARAAFRVRIGHVVRDARNIVRDVSEASGSSAHNLQNPLQRALRDLETASCHTVFDLDVSSEAYGRLLLGLASNTPL